MWITAVNKLSNIDTRKADQSISSATPAESWLWRSLGIKCDVRSDLLLWSLGKSLGGIRGESARDHRLCPWRVWVECINDGTRVLFNKARTCLPLHPCTPLVYQQGAALLFPNRQQGQAEGGMPLKHTNWLLERRMAINQAGKQM